MISSFPERLDKIKNRWNGQWLKTEQQAKFHLLTDDLETEEDKADLLIPREVHSECLKLLEMATSWNALMQK